jgi:hypothetical protein
MKKVSTKQKFGTTFHLQIDGRTGKMNEILNQYFYNYIIDNRKDWGNH